MSGYGCDWGENSDFPLPIVELWEVRGKARYSEKV